MEKLMQMEKRAVKRAKKKKMRMRMRKTMTTILRCWTCSVMPWKCKASIRLARSES